MRIMKNKMTKRKPANNNISIIRRMVGMSMAVARLSFIIT